MKASSKNVKTFAFMKGTSTFFPVWAITEVPFLTFQLKVKREPKVHHF